MKTIAATLMLLCLHTSLQAQHTFSIVAVDTLTGEVGSAGATCLNGAGGNPSAIIISDVIPGLGAFHTQAQWDPDNQFTVHDRATKGDSAQQIINWVTSNDVAGSPEIRQYGVALLKNGHPQAAAYTGPGCMDYKNHIVGRFYSIQGNILIGKKVLDSMEARFLRSGGQLDERLMAALQGAKIPGADSRCLAEGISSKSSFIRVARPGNSVNNLYLDIKVVTTPSGYDPIDSLQIKYNYWRSTAGVNEAGVRENVSLYPNPCEKTCTLQLENISGNPYYELTNLNGKVLQTQAIANTHTDIQTAQLAAGVYLLRIYRNAQLVSVNKLLR